MIVSLGKDAKISSIHNYYIKTVCEFVKKNCQLNQNHVIQFFLSFIHLKLIHWKYIL